MVDTSHRPAPAQLDGTAVDPLRRVLAHVGVPVGVHVAGRVVVANGALAALLGVAGPEELEGRLVGDLVAPADRARVVGRMARALEGEQVGPATMSLRTARGDELPVEVTPTPIVVDGERGVLLAVRDLTAWREAEEALRASESRWRALVQHGTDLMVVLGVDGRFTYVSPSLHTVLRHSPEDLLGTSAFDLIHPDDAALAQRGLARRVEAPELPHTSIRIRLRNGDGEWRWFDTFAANLLEDPDVRGIIVNAWDVTEQVRAERHLRHLAHHDGLTGLPNRLLLAERLLAAVSEGRQAGTVTGLLMLDLDRFKDVNDTLGHESGDRVLATLARRLATAVREGDLVARIGGDEFAVVLPDAGDAGTVQAVARRLLDACVEPVVDQGMVLRLGASIGMVLAPEHGDEPSMLMRRVDAAMYRAKVEGLGIVVASDGDLDEGRRRLAAAGDIRRALDHGELRCAYQPKVDLRTGSVVGVEALARWDHPVRGLVPPEELVVDSEAVGLMVPVTAWVLAEALGHLREWVADGLDLTVAVNVSATTLHDAGFTALVTSALERAGVAASRLVLEVTEQAAMVDPDASLATMTALHDLGVRFSVDDFGTGQSSLTYLHRLPVAEVKIDRSFVVGLEANPADGVICRSVIDLAHNLGLQAVAEGVETPALASILVGFGCDLGQGYELGRPVAAGAVPGVCRDAGWGP